MWTLCLERPLVLPGVSLPLPPSDSPAPPPPRMVPTAHRAPHPSAIATHSAPTSTPAPTLQRDSHPSAPISTPAPTSVIDAHPHPGAGAPLEAAHGADIPLHGSVGGRAWRSDPDRRALEPALATFWPAGRGRSGSGGRRAHRPRVPLRDLGSTRRPLSAALRVARVAYVPMPEIGGRPDDPALYLPDGRLSYRFLVATPAWQSGIDRLVNGAARMRIRGHVLGGGSGGCHPPPGHRPGPGRSRHRGQAPPGDGRLQDEPDLVLEVAGRAPAERRRLEEALSQGCSVRAIRAAKALIRPGRFLPTGSP